jgi:hypothetical protein
MLLLCFLGQKGTSVQVWGYARSHASPDSSSSPKSALSHICTLGTMCNLSLGVWETHLHTLCPVLIKNK